MIYQFEHGETTSEEDDTYSQCEECGQFYLDSRGYDYCPNCGRKIKEQTGVTERKERKANGRY